MIKPLYPVTNLSPKLNIRTDKIVVCFVNPPIPSRKCDWIAHYDNDEPNDDGNFLHGFGKTPTEAVADLLQSADNH